MNTYRIVFHYTLDVEASDHEEAEALAWLDFNEQIGNNCMALEFVTSPAELVGDNSEVAL